MKNNYEDLLALLVKFPVHFSASAVETVRGIAHKYGKILKLVMDSSDVYESNAEDFPAELNQVEDELQQSLYGKQDNETLFWEAVGKLKDDIKDLAGMINEQEGFE